MTSNLLHTCKTFQIWVCLFLLTLIYACSGSIPKSRPSLEDLSPPAGDSTDKSSYLRSRALIPVEYSALKAQVLGQPIEPAVPGAQLIQDLDQHIQALKKYYSRPRPLVFGPLTLSSSDYIQAVERFRAGVVDCPEGELTAQWEQCLWARLEDEFQVMAVYGKESVADVFMTGYYSPLLVGKLRPQGEWTRPLYGIPQDLIEVDLKDFGLPPKKLRGRILGQKNDPSQAERSWEGTQQLVPYYDRKQIDEEEKIKRAAKVLAYVNPVDAFFLQIQGSGSVLIQGKKKAKERLVHLVYGAQNGHPYVAIGKFIKEKLMADLQAQNPGQSVEAPQITAQTIIDFLNQSPKNAQAIMNQNPSYVFFKESLEPSLTYIGSPAVAKRTFASDRRYFPLGGMALLNFAGKLQLAFDHDKGGAIFGGGRIDYYWGTGSEASDLAGNTQGRGKLWYLVPKGNSVVNSGSLDQ